MTLLQIDKRAETELEGQDLIDRSLKLCDPFDVPVLCLTNQDFSDWHNKTKSILRPETASIFQRAWSFIKGSNEGDLFVPENLKFGFVEQKAIDVFTSKPLQGCSLKEKLAAKILLGMQFQFLTLGADVDLKADNSHLNLLSHSSSDTMLDARKIKDLSVSIVSIDEKKDRLEHLSASKVKSFHGADRFSTIWHEFSHATGAGEPQADMMAAIVTRQAFSPSDVCRRIADQRAIHAIVGFEDKGVREKYGWGVVDANDYVASLSDEKILGITEEQIKSLRFQKFDSLSDAIYRVGRVVKEDPDNLYAHINKTFRDDKVAQYISQRFAYAIERSDRMGMGLYTMPNMPDGKYPSFIDEPEI